MNNTIEGLAEIGCEEVFEEAPVIAEDAHLDVRGEGDDVSEYEGEPQRDEPWDSFRTDAEADGDALASAGMGTDEDYGCYGYFGE